VLAAPKGDAQEIRRLVEAGADSCRKDRHGMTARIRAENRGRQAIASLLLEAEEKWGCSEKWAAHLADNRKQQMA
jgi:ankyrin repeat protein